MLLQSCENQKAGTQEGRPRGLEKASCVVHNIEGEIITTLIVGDRIYNFAEMQKIGERGKTEHIARGAALGTSESTRG